MTIDGYDRGMNAFPKPIIGKIYTPKGKCGKYIQRIV
jgi:hypothetical protein